jgi:membrane-associated phospholipid phosphatase
MKKLAVAALTCVAIAMASAPAHAQEAPRLQWNDDWPRFRDIGYWLISGSVASALAVTFLIPYPDNPRWQGGILFDDAVRTGIRMRDPDHRDAIRRASDVTMFTSILHVGILDSLVVPLAENSTDVALQLTLMNLQAFSLNTLVATLLFKTAARQRPLVQDCFEKEGYDDPLCDSGQYASFPSSHTSTAFTAAGLSCVHHQFLPLYGGGWDGVGCAISLTTAFATGLFRVVGDRHYATDVTFGAIAGFSLGYIYPWLFHYRFDLDDRSQSASGALQWAVIPGGGAEAPYGLSIAGGF